MKAAQRLKRRDTPGAPLQSVNVLDLAQCVEVLRQRQSELEAEIRIWKDRSSRLAASESAAHAYATELQGEISRLQVEISRGGEYVTGLLQQMDDERRSASSVNAEIARLRSEVAQLTDAKNRLQREVELTRKSAIAEKVVTSEYIASLKDRLRDLESVEKNAQEMRVQLEQFSTIVQTESITLSQLIGAVQSSRFWSLKRFLLRQKLRLARPFTHFAGARK